MSRSGLAAAVRYLRCQLAPRRPSEESDESLLHGFAERREENAFAVLMRRHGPMVLHVCRRVLGHEQDAEDAFQATFLVLARNAAALRKKTALAGFLHGTAYRLALTAKRAAARRRKYEGQTPTRSSTDPSEELRWREVRAMLDEEIARLPETYRSVFVLCYLENLSQAEAGKRLGLKERTVSNRLAAARKRLSQRLARHGVELTALLGAASLATPSASAMPAGLMASTIQAVLATAAGEGLAGVVSASVAEMVKSASVAMMVSKAKIATVVLLAMSMLAGASVWAYRGVAVNALPSSAQSEEPPRAKENEIKAAAPKRETAKTEEIKGRVLDPEGKPKAGTKLLFLSEDKSRELGVTAADGRFTVSVPKESKGYLIARPNDAGMEFVSLRQSQPGKPVELRLVKDHVIRGRIVNTEGKPVRGVRIGIRAVIDNTDNALESFLIGRKKRQMSGRFFGKRALWNPAAVLRGATTDADGRFAVHGMGANRIVYLRLSGAGIAEDEIWIVNREGFDPKPYNQPALANFVPLGRPLEGRELGLLYGSDVSVVAEAEKPIYGLVTDSDSGKGRPNVVVYLSSPGNTPIPVPVQATSDTQGRYEIHGSRKAKSYTLEVVSDAETGYMASQIHAADTAGYQPLRADIRIKKGVIVTGKIIDRATGQSLPGFAQTGILGDNPFVKEYPECNASQLGRGNRVNTTADNSFRIVIIPGPVLLMGGYYPLETEKFDYIEFCKYRPAVADPEYPHYFSPYKELPGYLKSRGRYGALQGNYCKVLDIKPGIAVIHQDILLERASILEVKIRDADGRPMAGVWATDFATGSYICPLWIERATCPVYGLEQREPRLLIFYEPTKKIIGSRHLQGDEKAPLVVALGAMAAIKGRLLDSDGKPLVGVEVAVQYREEEAEKMYRLVHMAKQIVTDATGAFTLDELIPEVKFELSVRRGKRRFERETKSAGSIIQVKPGACRDLGAIPLKPMSKKEGE